MTLRALVERYAQYEKRGVVFYRGLAERFASTPVAARIWRELSNTEASHFALLELCEDWIAMAKESASAPPVTPEALNALEARMAELEARAQETSCSLEEGLGLTVTWEELELPRILELVDHLPGQARGRIMAGMIAEAAEHYRLLAELVRSAGAPVEAGRVEALAAQARAALG